MFLWIFQRPSCFFFFPLNYHRLSFFGSSCPSSLLHDGQRNIWPSLYVPFTTLIFLLSLLVANLSLWGFFSIAESIEIRNRTDQSLQGVYNPGDIAWILSSTALVWIMVPGVGFFYSGLLRRKNALSMIYLSMMCLAVVSFQVSFQFSIFISVGVLLVSSPISVVLLGLLSRVQRDGKQIHWGLECGPFISFPNVTDVSCRVFRPEGSFGATIYR